MKIGALAARTGLTVSAIRHYEDMGLIRPGPMARPTSPGWKPSRR